MRGRPVILRLFGGLLAAALVFYLLLPVAVEVLLVPRLFAAYSLDAYRIDVRRFGCNGFDLGNIVIGNPARPALSIDSLQVDYTLPGLFNKRIDSIACSGMRLHITARDGRLTLEGLDIDRFVSSRAAVTKDGEARQSPELPIVIDSLVVRNSLIRLDYQERSILLPFSLEKGLVGFSGPDAQPFLTGVWHFSPQGREIVFNTEYSPAERLIELDCSAPGFQLSWLTDILAVPDLSLTGEIDISGSAAVSLNPLRLQRVRGVLAPQSMAIAYKNISLVDLPPAAGQVATSRVEIIGAGDEVHLDITGMALAAPFPLRLAEIEGDFRRDGKNVSGTGALRLVSATDDQHRSAIHPSEPITLDARFTAEYVSPRNWLLNLANGAESTGEDADAWMIAGPGVEISSEAPVFELTIRGDGSAVTARYNLCLSELAATTATATLAIPLVTLAGEAVFDGGSGGRTPKSSFTVTAPSSVGQAGPLAVRGDFSFNGEASSAAGGPSSPDRVQIGGTARLGGTEVEIADWQLRLTGISGELPLQWPVVETVQEGMISAATRWRKSDLGDLVLVVRQQGGGFSFAGSHDSLLLPGMRLDFKGDAGYEAGRGLGADITFQIPRYNFSGVRPGELLDMDQAITVDGQLEVDGKVSTAGGGNIGTMQIGIKEGRLAHAGSETLIEGVELDLAFDDLFALRSRPGQRLSFLQASLGEFSMQAGRVDFQIESPRSLLVERSSVRWCSGLVNSNAVRFMPGRSDYSISLYCDRLNLSEILEQFGVSDARGQGTVNGLLPLDFSGGEISFKGGYLYSSPGEDGHVQVAGAGNLLAGVPKGSPQFMQLDFAMAAMKDFSYDWVKMSLDTEADDLLLKLRLNGKPASPLPFRYDNNQGLFVRYSGDAGRGLWQPILLDVNFRLPLNRILEYTSGINNLLNRWH